MARLNVIEGYCRVIGRIDLLIGQISYGTNDYPINDCQCTYEFEQKLYCHLSAVKILYV